MELVNLSTDPNYGAMWKLRPPNCVSDHTPQPPPQTDVEESVVHQGCEQQQQFATKITPIGYHHARLITQHRPTCKVFKTNVTTLTSFLPPEPALVQECSGSAQKLHIDQTLNSSLAYVQDVH